jgi:flagellar FliL protein
MMAADKKKTGDSSGGSGLMMGLIAATVIGGGGGALLGFGVIGPMIPTKPEGAAVTAPAEASGEGEKGHDGGSEKAAGDAHGAPAEGGGGHGGGGEHGGASEGEASGHGGGHGGDAHGSGHGGGGGHGDSKGKTPPAGAPHKDLSKGHVKELPAVVTNLAGAERHWVRLQSAIIYDPEELPHIEPLIAELTSDITAFLGTLEIANIEGPDGLRRLQEELSERVATRSDRHVQGFVIETMVVQ